MLKSRTEFLHEERFPRYEIESIETSEGRRYRVPNGPSEVLYESVTTALGNLPGKKEALNEWRRKVGYEEANRISRIASSRGTSLHKIAENYLDNKEDFYEKAMPNAIALFNSLRPILDKSISKVYTQETPLFSHKYKLAGRVDCIAECAGSLSVIDFKTSRKVKKREWIQDYFLQTAAYSFMVEEMYEERVKQVVIFICVDDNPVQIFIDDPYKYKDDVFFKNRI